MINISFLEKALKVKPVKIGKPAIRSIDGFSIDSRVIEPSHCFIAIKGENFDGDTFITECYNKGVRCFVAHKSYLYKVKKLLADSIVFPVSDTILSLAKLAQEYKSTTFASIFAITGSSGKTTTRELIVKILSKKYSVHTAKKNFNNEIGLPLTILEAPLHTHIIVLELGMNHKGEVKNLSKLARPLAGLITNVGYAHIGQFGSLDAIAQAKSEIFEGISRHGFIFLNRDDAYYSYFKSIANCEIIDFGQSDLNIIENRNLDGYQLSYDGKEFHFPLAGRHNLQNLAAAIQAGKFYQIDSSDMISAIESFSPVSGRSEIIRKEFTIINDCYNANPSSMLAALEMLSETPGRKIAVLSDMLELGNLSEKLHSETGNSISEKKYAEIVFACGSGGEIIIESIHNPDIHSLWFETKAELIETLLKTIRKGDTILVKASRGMKMEDVVKALAETAV